MDNKIVKVIFKEGWETMYSNDLTKCDYGQVLQIEGITLPDGNVEVHFSLTEHNGEAPISIGTVKENVITVDIPDFILQKKDVYADSYQAYAWIYVTDGESGRTIRKIVFTIDTRAKPTTNVPEDQKDPFLQEVRQVLAETKEVAQSVRDDADNGKFSGIPGEKGEKGDAGSIKFVIVPTLPTEDIDASAIYMVPLGNMDKNSFAEYIYIDGAWECVGSASVEVNLDDYVKNTDYATKDNAGVVKVLTGTQGLDITDGKIRVSQASKTIIDEKKHAYKPIVPLTLDYAVKKALSDCKLSGDDAWTEEEKASALETLGGVASSNVSQTVQGLKAVQRLNGGGILVPIAPTGDSHATSKKYVDDLVGSVESILTELHAHAESLIGGEA